LTGAAAVTVARTVHVRIAGRVQGVYFRAWTAEKARTLGLSGWVRNRRDGSVEAVFSGEPQAVEDMLARCRDGPRDAVVSTVEILAEGGAAPDGFTVLPTA
jgi:acylphosphatase